MTDETPAFRYRAIAKDDTGQVVIEIFTSSVEYMAGDELPLSSRRWHVRTVRQEGIAHIHGEDQAVRELDCVLR